MDLIKNWKIHVCALVIVIIAEMIGIQKFGLIVFLPLLYSLVLGALVSFPKWNFVKPKEMDRAGKMLSIGMMMLMAPPTSPIFQPSLGAPVTSSSPAGSP